MQVINCEQLSPEWMKLRAGLPTASNFDNIVTSKGEPSKQAQKYMYQLAGERVTGAKEEVYQSTAMEQGIIKEDEARMLYELMHTDKVEQVGFCLTDDGAYGCSPDGLIGEDGGIEIKCPLIHTHVEYLLKGVLPTKYIQQVQGSMLVTGRKWWVFMSYYPSMKPLIVRVLPDISFQASLKVELDFFCKKLDEITEKIK